MLTKGAIEDLIMRHLSSPDNGIEEELHCPVPYGKERAPGGPGGAAPLAKKKAVPEKRVFISDWELRRLYKPGAKSVRVPAGSIVSPLSLDWLDYNGITVVRN